MRLKSSASTLNAMRDRTNRNRFQACSVLTENKIQTPFRNITAFVRINMVSPIRLEQYFGNGSIIQLLTIPDRVLNNELLVISSR